MPPDHSRPPASSGRDGATGPAPGSTGPLSTAQTQDASGGMGLIRTLGTFSLALGLPSLVAPGLVSRWIGVAPTAGTMTLLRGVGVQEVGVGAGLLTRPRPTMLQWSRVLGDVLHLGLLGRAVADENNERSLTSGVMAAVAGITVVDLIAAIRLSRSAAGQPPKGRLRAKRSITVRRPVEEVYRHWRDLENLPEFMWHLRSVDEDDGSGRSHWVANAPGRKAVEWDAEIVEDSPAERIAWRSVEGAKVPNRGAVWFTTAPGDRGTEVHVEIEYDPPGRSLGAAVAKLLGESPDQQMADDLRRFKQVMETGEVLRSDGSPEGTRTGAQLQQRAAQPAQKEG